jgi:hypothetical protein
MEKVLVSWEQVKELLPARVSLYYVDYQDSLDEHLGVLQECIHNQNQESLYEKTDEWYIESPFYAFEYLDQELKSDIERAFDVDEDEAEEIFEEFRESIRDEYYERDDSTLIKDLLRNTGKQTMFYDTGYYVADGSWNFNEKEMAQEVKSIKRALGLKIRDTQYDQKLTELIANASYGGSLVIYFYESAEDFFNLENSNVINFKDACVAIIHTGNGSGFDTQLVGSEISLPLNPKNIFLCKNINYSYTFEVCGMSSNWCSDTTVSFSKKRTKKVAEVSPMNAAMEREAELDAIYAKGGCTFGDMKYSRHRDTEYINDFPCGNRCKKCKTFWID